MVDFILRHGNDLLAVDCMRGLEVLSGEVWSDTSFVWGGVV